MAFDLRIGGAGGETELGREEIEDAGETDESRVARDRPGRESGEVRCVLIRLALLINGGWTGFFNRRSRAFLLVAAARFLLVAAMSVFYPCPRSLQLF